MWHGSGESRPQREREQLGLEKTGRYRGERGSKSLREVKLSVRPIITGLGCCQGLVQSGFTEG